MRNELGDVLMRGLLGVTHLQVCDFEAYFSFQCLLVSTSLLNALCPREE